MRPTHLILVPPLGALWIVRRRRGVEEVEVVRAVLDAAAKNVNYGPQRVAPASLAQKRAVV